MGTQSRQPREFPWSELIPEVAVGIPALLIALFCTVLLASYLGPQFDVVIFNDHVIGGTEDQLTVIAVGTVFGAIAVFCSLRVWSRFVEWRRESEAPRTSITPR